MTRPGDTDIPLPEPLVRHPDVRPAAEDRSYIIYFAGALITGLGGGFLLAVILSLLLAGTIDFSQDSTRLTQAHGWAQLQGWIGLFVAGMALRLIPRFAGRKPLSWKINVAIFALLAVGAVGRTTAQSHGTGDVAGLTLLVSNLVAAAGVAGVAAVLTVTLALGRKRPEAWRYFAWAGTLWWFAWAALLVWTGLEGRSDALVPPQLDETATWIVMFGAIGNFVWAVQGRSVPVFFGRKLPALRRIAVPAVLSNAGVAILLLAVLLDADAPSVRLTATGLLAAAIGLVALAPLTGAVWGSATRLRPRSRAAARFVLVANISAVLAGLLLATHATATLIEGQPELYGFRDAARHALGLGLFTALIFGMAQLVAPVFALERAEKHGPGLLDHLALYAIVAAILLRVSTGLLEDIIDLEPRMHIAATAGSLAWIAVAAFATSVIRAVRKEPAMKALLEDRVTNPKR